MLRADGILVLVSTAVFCAVIVHVIIGAVPSSQRLSSRQVVDNCTTDLARDLYGLGVRLGVYFQWFSGWVANTFVVDEIAGTLDANAIFLFALLIAIVNSTSSEMLAQLDAVIMIQLCAGTVWSVLSLWGYRTAIYRKQGLDGIRNFGGFGTHLRLLLGGALGWYSVWFWIKGVVPGPAGLEPFGKFPEGQFCSLTKVRIFSRQITNPEVKYAALAISGGWLTYSVIICLSAPLAGVTRIMKMVSLFRSKQYANTTRLRFATGATERQLVIASWVFSVFNIFTVIFLMLVIEITLNENNVIDVIGGSRASNNGYILTPGQLLPMLIGAFSFVRILYTAWELWRSPEGDITPSLGRNDSRRYSKIQRDSAKGVNVLQLFSTGIDGAEAGGEHDQAQSQWHNENHDPFKDLRERLNWFQRFLITWLPWVSLIYFWPWTKDVGHPVPQNEDEMQLTPHTNVDSPPSSHRTRFAEYEEEDESHSMDTSYRRQSHLSASDAYAAQKPLERI